MKEVRLLIESSPEAAHRHQLVWHIGYIFRVILCELAFAVKVVVGFIAWHCLTFAGYIAYGVKRCLRRR